MKRTFTFIAALLLMAQANAAPIGEQKAKEIARQFMMEKAGKNAQQSLDISFAEQSMETAIETDELYVFNSDNSFVVVSGDDRTIPVLGWSDEGKYDAQKANPAVDQWLDYYKHEIQSLDGDVTPVKELTSWGNIDPIVPYHWDQPAPYNKLVPKDAKDGKPSMAGCASISLAQMLATLKYPSGTMQRGIPAQEVYEMKDKQRVHKQHLDALPATSFNWNILKTKYEATETGESVDEVAKLIKYCGYALGMSYSSSLSSAQSLSTYNATCLFFGFPETKIAYRSGYMKAKWENLIYGELQAGRPVIHDAAKAENGKISGHSFIIDGYKDGYYHVNWGWGGQQDGYFMLSVLNSYYPEEKGTEVTSGYNYFCSVLYNFVKPTSSSNTSDSYAIAVDKMGVNNGEKYADEVIVYPKKGYYTFDHNLEVSHAMAPFVDRNYQLGWNIYSYNEGKYVMDTPCTNDELNVKLLSGEIREMTQLYTTVQDDTENGDYALVWFYKDLEANDKNWYQMANSNDDFLCFTIYNGACKLFPNYDDMIRAKDIVVNDVSVLQDDKPVKVVDDVPEVKVYEKATIVYNIKNETCSHNRGIYLWYSDDDKKYEMVCGRGLNTDIKTTGDLYMNFMPYSVGDFWVVLNNLGEETYDKKEDVQVTKLYVTGTSMSAVVNNVDEEKSDVKNKQLKDNSIKGTATITTTENLPYSTSLYVILKYEDDNGYFTYDTTPLSKYNKMIEGNFVDKKELKEDFEFPDLGKNLKFMLSIGKDVDGNIMEVDSEAEVYITPSETAIVNVNGNENGNSAAPVKVMKNGKLYIGNYNIAGQQVR